MFQPNPLQNLFIETIFNTALALLSILIFFQTKELYALTKHKGIRYFRYSFLAFAISFVIKIIIPFYRPVMMRGPSIEMYYLSIAYILFSLLAVLYLLYGMLWKHLEKIKINSSLLPVLFALILTIFSDTSRFRQGNNIVQLFLMILVAVIAIYNYSKQKKKHFSIYILYILLFFSVIIHNIAFFTLKISTTLGILLYLLSALLFFMILYKVWSRTK